MRHYSEAVKCMDEAMSYVLVSRGEVLFRRAQAIMYNKFSEALLMSLIYTVSREEIRNDKFKGDIFDFLYKITISNEFKHLMRQFLLSPFWYDLMPSTYSIFIFANSLLLVKLIVGFIISLNVASESTRIISQLTIEYPTKDSLNRVLIMFSMFFNSSIAFSF